jgi:MiaB-like tRNA modifying enzyme
MQQNIYVEAYGCALNFADYERLVNLLLDYGYQIVEDPEHADVVIIHTCTVKETTMNRMYHRIRLYSEQNKRVIVSGCLAKTDTKRLAGYETLPPEDIHNIQSLLKPKTGEKTKHSPFRTHNNISIIPISSGCLGDCTYCKVKLARGKLVSRPLNEILEDIKEDVKNGIKEFWLTSQDLGCYGMDLNTDLPTLLKAIDQLTGAFNVRLGMINPQYVIRFKQELINILHSDRFYSFLHIPLQSGSDTILKRMKRTYLIEDAIDAIQEIQSAHPQLSLVTDVIVGFPGETDTDFEQTKQALSTLEPDNINISRFSSLVGTEAHSYEDKCPSETIVERSKELTKQYHHLAQKKNKTWIGWHGLAWITETGKKNTFIARNQSYKQIIIPHQTDLDIGDTLSVVITDTSSFDLKARIKKRIAIQ